MREAMAHVTSAISLVTFLAALAAAVYHRRMPQHERMIKLAPLEERGPVSATLKRPGQATDRTRQRGCCACSWGAYMKDNVCATHATCC